MAEKSLKVVVLNGDWVDLSKTIPVANIHWNSLNTVQVTAQFG